MRPITEIAKHWMLNLAVHYPMPLGLVLPAVNSLALNVRPIPQFAPEDYARCLLELVDSSLINLRSDDDLPLTDRSSIVNIIDQFLRHPIINRDDEDPRQMPRRVLPKVTLNLSLSPLGGDAWEQKAKPDWQRLVTLSVADIEGELMSANLDKLIAYLGWCNETIGRNIRRETIDIKALSDHNILYWKRLPVVYHSSFEMHPHQESDGREAPGWFQDWETSTSLAWCTQPWELPEWPAKDRIPRGEE